MTITLVVLGYLKWHYNKALKSLGNIWKNFLFFLAEFFSLRELARNLFDPWKRMTDPYPKHFTFKDYLFTFIINMITRLVGMIMRLALLIVGLTVYLIFCLCFPVVVCFWLFLPLIVIALFVIAFYLIIK